MTYYTDIMLNCIHARRHAPRTVFFFPFWFDWSCTAAAAQHVRRDAARETWCGGRQYEYIATKKTAMYKYANFRNIQEWKPSEKKNKVSGDIGKDTERRTCQLHGFSGTQSRGVFVFQVEPEPATGFAGPGLTCRVPGVLFAEVQL